MEPERPLVAWVLGVKRYVTYRALDDGHVEIVGYSEHALVCEDPPGAPPRGPDHHRSWVADALRRLIGHRLSGGAGPVSFPGEDFPVLRRLTAGSTAVADTLPAAFGAKPGTYFVEGQLSSIQPYRPDVASVVALDRDGDLSDWQAYDWRDRHTSAPVQVSTDVTDVGAVILESVGSLFNRWARPMPRRPVPEAVHIVSERTRHTGRPGAALRGDPVVIFCDEDEAALLRRAARVLGPSRLAELTGTPPRTVAGWKRRRPRASTAAAALDRLAEAHGPEAVDRLVVEVEAATERRCRNCGKPLSGAQSRWCSESCRKRASRTLRVAERRSS